MLVELDDLGNPMYRLSRDQSATCLPGEIPLGMFNGQTDPCVGEWYQGDGPYGFYSPGQEFCRING